MMNIIYLPPSVIPALPAPSCSGGGASAFASGDGLASPQDNNKLGNAAERLGAARDNTPTDGGVNALASPYANPPAEKVHEGEWHQRQDPARLEGDTADRLRLQLQAANPLARPSVQNAQALNAYVAIRQEEGGQTPSKGGRLDLIV